MFQGLAEQRDTAEARGSSAEPRCEPPRPRVKAVDRAQVRLEVLDLERMIAEDHPARAIWAFVGTLNFSAYERKIRSVEGKAGRSRTDPRVLAAVWIYEYSRGLGSGREIARQSAYDPALRWLTGGETLDAHVLTSFRAQEEIRELFSEALAVLAGNGLIELQRVAQDGTRIRANAGADTFRRKGTIEEKLQEAQAHIAAVDQQEEGGSKRRQKAQERARREREARLQKAREQFADVEQSRRRKRKDVSKARVSTTDPEARIMKNGDGGYAPSYNAQVVVDAKAGVIVAAEITQASSDAQQLEPMLKRVEEEFAKKPAEVLADGGYATKHNINVAAEAGVELYAPVPDDKGRVRSALKNNGVTDAFAAAAFASGAEGDCLICPAGVTLRLVKIRSDVGEVVREYRAAASACLACRSKALCCPKAKRHGRTVSRREPSAALVAFRKKMEQEEAKQIYRKRGSLVELAFAWLKSKMGLRQFMLRGAVKAGLEFKWACLAYNVKRCLPYLREAGATANAA